MCFRVFCVTGAFAFVAALAFPQSDYIISVGAFSDRSTAQNRLDQLGLQLPDTPMEIVSKDQTLFVESNVYDTYAEAWSDVQGLDEPGNYRIISLPEISNRDKIAKPNRIFDVSGLGETISDIRQSQSAFDKSKVPLPSQDELNMEISSMSSDQLYRVGFHAETNGVGIPALEKFVTNNSADERIHAGCLRLARRYLGRKNFERVDELLSTVEANGSEAEIGQAKLLRAYSTLYDDTFTHKEAFKEFRNIASSLSP